MKLVLQRVSNANVVIEGKEVAKISKGLLVLVGIGKDTNEEGMKFLAEKVMNLRIFQDDEGKMNLSILDVKGEILLVSQFTLYADCRKGRRPSYTDAASPDEAKKMYERFVEILKEIYPYKVESGIFQAMMDVTLCNAGPVTIILDGEELKKK
jgi:D-tyrosyl-tRNA(Tyr) deacylase